MEPAAVSKRALQAARSLLGREGGLARVASMTPSQLSAAGRRAALVRHYGWCPRCEVEPNTPDHACEAPEP